MDDRTPMETRPPVLIETIVRWLVPPAAREHVLGDLSERCTSARQYAVDALRTVPYVVVSQIRRTTNAASLLIPAFLLMLGFGPGPGGSFWISGGVTTAVALIGLVLRDAYRIPDPNRPWRQGLVDIGIVLACVAATQAAIALVSPEWLRTLGTITRSIPILALLYVIRVQNPAGAVSSSQLTSASALSLADIRHEVRLYEQGTRRAVGIEIAVGAVVCPFFTGFALFAVDAPFAVRVGAALGAAGALFIISRMWSRWRLQPIPADALFTETVARYRDRLEQQHRSLRTAWRWYGLSLAAGPTTILVAAASASTQPVVAIGGALLGSLAVGLFFHRAIFIRAARLLRQRIDALATVKELS